MTTAVLSPPSLDSESTLVLAAYSAAQSVDTAEVADDETVGWVPRLATVQQVPTERLPPVHGKLIALGLLRFQLLDRAGGMMYRLSPEGRSVLAGVLGPKVPTPSPSTNGSGEVDALDEMWLATDETAVDAAFLDN